MKSNTLKFGNFYNAVAYIKQAIINKLTSISQGLEKIDANEDLHLKRYGFNRFFKIKLKETDKYDNTDTKVHLMILLDANSESLPDVQDNQVYLKVIATHHRYKHTCDFCGYSGVDKRCECIEREYNKQEFHEATNRYPVPTEMRKSQKGMGHPPEWFLESIEIDEDDLSYVIDEVERRFEKWALIVSQDTRDF